MSLRVGLLGMPDNVSTRIIVAELARVGRRLDVVLLQDPGIGAQWQRVRRKFRAAGLGATLRRVVFAAKARLWSRGAIATADLVRWPAAVHRIGDVNSEATRQRLRDERLDLLLIVTDSMLRRATFSIPRIGTLNAHPGWLPAYRGLGSPLRMLRDGMAPAVSVHLVDEGVDTGPVILRELIDPAAALAGPAGDIACCREQARLFAKAVALFEAGPVIPIDTFLEPSSMSRGLSATEARAIYSSVRRGGLSVPASAS